MVVKKKAKKTNTKKNVVSKKVNKIDNTIKTKNKETKNNFDIFKNPYFYAGVVLGILIIVGIIMALSGNSEVVNNNVSNYNSDTNSATVTYFLDFQCPFCALFTKEHLLPALEKYPNVKVEPVIVAFLDARSELKDSHNAAQAYFCAEKQGKGLEMFKALELWAYENEVKQRKGENIGIFSKENIMKLIDKIVGIDKQKFENCYDNDDFSAKLEANLRLMNERGHRGTPGVELNSRTINWQNIENEIKKLLGGKIPKANLIAVYPDDCKNCEVASKLVENALKSDFDVNYVHLTKYNDYNISVYPAFFVETDGNSKLLSMFNKINNGLYAVYDLNGYANLFLASGGYLVPYYYENSLAKDKELVYIGNPLNPYDFAYFYADLNIIFDKLEEKNYTFKYIPLAYENVFPNGKDASLALYCASDQNKFKEYAFALHDVLGNIFKKIDKNVKTAEEFRQKYAELLKENLNADSFIAIAKDVNLNMAMFDDCYKDKTILDLYQLELSKYLVNGSPVFFVGHYYEPGYEKDRLLNLIK